MNLVLLVLGAAVGAPLRYLVDRFVQSRHDSAFPWGTFAVNVTGSFLLGAVVGSGLDGAGLVLFGPGLCGALTTYSTFGYETVRLVEEAAHLRAAANVALSLAAGLGAACAGALLGSAVF